MLVVIVALCVSRIVCVCVVCHNEILYLVLQRFSYGLLFRKPLSVLFFGLYHNVHLHVVVS